MKYLTGTLFLVLIGFALVGLSTTYQKFMTQKTIQENSIQLPDYSGIQITRILSKDLATGSGGLITNGDRAQVYLSLWIYDPAKPSNQGLLLFQNSDDQPETIFFSKKEPLSILMEGMKKNSARELIIPELENDFIKKYFKDIPVGAILLLDIRVFRVF